MKALLKCAIFAVWALALIFAARADEMKALKPGDAFPDVTKCKVEGKWPELKGHVVLIDFWASWCPPCRKSFPYMKYFHERFAERGLVVIGISVDDYVGPMNAFLKENPMPFTMLWDKETAIPEALGVDRLPYSFLIGADGTVLAVHNKFNSEKTPKEYLDQVKAALKAAGK